MNIRRSTPVYYFIVYENRPTERVCEAPLRSALRMWVCSFGVLRSTLVRAGGRDERTPFCRNQLRAKKTAQKRALRHLRRTAFVAVQVSVPPRQSWRSPRGRVRRSRRLSQQRRALRGCVGRTGVFCDWVLTKRSLLPILWNFIEL